MVSYRYRLGIGSIFFVGLLAIGPNACSSNDDSGNETEPADQVGSVQVADFENTATKDSLPGKTEDVTTMLTSISSSFDGFTGTSSLQLGLQKTALAESNYYANPENLGALLAKSGTFACEDAAATINQIVSTTTTQIQNSVSQANSPEAVASNWGSGNEYIEVTDNGSSEQAAVNYTVASTAAAKDKGLEIGGTIKAGANDTQVFTLTDIKTVIDWSKLSQQSGGSSDISFVMTSDGKTAFVADSATKKVEIGIDQKVTLNSNDQVTVSNIAYDGALQGGDLPSVSYSGNMALQSSQTTGTLTFSQEAALKDANTLGISVSYSWDGTADAAYSAAFDLVRSDNGTCEVANAEVSGDVTSVADAAGSLSSSTQTPGET
jgi:hypothetical protein